MVKIKTSMSSPGFQLEQLCSSAQQEVVLVAPFIKVGTLERLISKIPVEVDLKCVTRWRPEEIISGVSDLEVWTLFRQRSRSSLWLRPDLHAKFYRADGKCLVGSANLTFTALGWSLHPNLELLVSIPVDHPEVVDFEETLLNGCVEVDDSIFEQVSSLVEALADEINIPPNVFESGDDQQSLANVTDIREWLPSLRNPEALYKAYIGALDQLTTALRQSALLDLGVLNPPKGLSKKAFEAYIGTQLLQMPIVHKVDSFVVSPQRFGAVRDLLASLPCAEIYDFDATRAWQNLMRWLLYFLSGRYTLNTPRHSEVFARKHS